MLPVYITYKSQISSTTPSCLMQSYMQAIRRFPNGISTLFIYPAVI